MKRISRIELYMQVAHLFSGRATCARGQVGAVLIRDKRIIASGYNGPPEGAHHCEDQHCDLSKPCTHAVHAEANLIAFCAKYGIATRGATLFITTSPCVKCAELIVQAGIIQVVYDSEYRDEAGINILFNASILLYKYDPTLKINWDAE